MNLKNTFLATGLLFLLSGCAETDDSVIKVTPLDEAPKPKTEMIPVEPDGGIGDGAESLDELLEAGATEALEAEILEEPSVSDAEPTAELEDETTEAISEPETTQTFSYETKHPTPKGITDMTTTFVLEDGVVKSLALVGNPVHRDSVEHHALYQAEIEGLIVGKSIAALPEAAPEKVNGSSLTSIGFNQALEQLRAES